MELNQYQILSKRTLPKHNSQEDMKLALANYSMGLVGESGECIDHIKKHVFHGHQLNVEEIKNELGDVLHYLAGIATMCGLSLDDIAVGNVAKLALRYPEGFTSEDSIKRVDTHVGK